VPTTSIAGARWAESRCDLAITSPRGRTSTLKVLVGLGFGRYLGGCLLVAVAAVSVGRAAVTLRSALLPWKGAPARLAETTIGLALATGVALLLGGVHRFSGWPVFVGFLALGLLVPPLARTIARRWPVAGAEVREPEVPGPRATLVERVVAVVAVAVVAAEWLSHTAWAFGHGMTEGDTLWYHGVFAARFVQTGRLDILPDIGAAAQGYFPANSQMFHAIAFFPFDRDLLSPVLNLLFAGLALLAAYCIGRRRGLGAVCVTGAALVLGLPAIVGTHPGQATNDLLCATFLLVAVALLVEGGIAPVPLALAGAMGALALGTKLTVALPLAVLTLVVVVLAARARRPGLLIAWLVPLVGLGAFWFLRNWVRVDNPLPWYDLHLGPLHFPIRSKLDDNASVAHYLFDGDMWTRIFRPGLHQAFGPWWPAIVAAPAVAGAALFGRDRSVGERIGAVVALAAGVGYVVMPFTMELGGAAFAATARYAAPALLVAVVMVPVALWLDRWPTTARRFGAVALLAGILVDALVPDVERFAPWRVADRPLAIGLVLVGFVVGAALRFGPRLLVVPLRLLGLVVAGFAVQSHYLERRYAVGAGLRLDYLNQYVSRHPPMRLAPFETIQFYPLFGPSYANAVEEVMPPRTAHSAEPGVRCREWETALRAAHVRFVLLGPDFVPQERPERAWFRRMQLVAAHGRTRLYRARGPLTLDCGS